MVTRVGGAQGQVLGGQPRHCLLLKCIVWFVSDSSLLLVIVCTNLNNKQTRNTNLGCSTTFPIVEDKCVYEWPYLNYLY